MTRLCTCPECFPSLAPTPEPSAEADAGLYRAVDDFAEVMQTWENGQGDIVEVIDAWAELRPLIEAALSRPATPPLDVDLLARAMTTVYEQDLFPIRGGGWRYDAECIAREYAALAIPTPEREG